MSQILGNELSRRQLLAALSDRLPRNLALSGPSYVGKRSCAADLLEEAVGTQDYLAADVGPDGARESRDFLSRLPVLGPFRAVLVDDADLLSDAAQDSWLKLLEDVPPRSVIVLVASDVDRLLPPLRSRVMTVIRWSRLSDDDVSESVRQSGAEPDSSAVRLCCGLPGLYEVLRLPAYAELRASVISHVEGTADRLFAPVPEAVKDLKSGRSPERDAVSLVCRRAALDAMGSRHVPAARRFLRFAADIVRVPSASGDIHWQRACLGS